METPTNEWNPTIQQGALMEWAISMKNPDKTAMNLTGYTVRGQLRRTFDSATVELDLATGSHVTISNAAGGIVTLSIAASVTATLSGSYKYDIELVNGSDVHRILQGTMTVSREVTR